MKGNPFGGLNLVGWRRDEANVPKGLEERAEVLQRAGAAPQLHPCIVSAMSRSRNWVTAGAGSLPSGSAPCRMRSRPAKPTPVWERFGAKHREFACESAEFKHLTLWAEMLRL